MYLARATKYVQAIVLKQQISRLFFWFLGVYFVALPLREILEANDKREEIIRQLTDWDMLSFTSPFSFFIQSLTIYLILYYIYPRLKNGLIIACLLTGLFGGIFFRAFLEEFVVRILRGEGNYNPNLSWTYYISDNLYYAIIFCSLGIAFYFIQLSSDNAQKKKDFELLQRDTEIKFLRSQINPHFLFNTLNNVYSLVNRHSPSALPALEKLSSLLRYSLYEKSASVPLHQEVEYLHQFIELESMRIDDLIPIQWQVNGNTKNWKIPPLLLVPFIENAFKHGDLKDPSRPLNISLETKKQDKLVFAIKNKIKKNIRSKDSTGGIGLTNVKKRLKLLYPDKHQLTIKEEEDIFFVELQLTTKQPSTFK